jgi:Protein of unknown function (DUF2752)
MSRRIALAWILRFGYRPPSFPGPCFPARPARAYLVERGPTVNLRAHAVHPLGWPIRWLLLAAAAGILGLLVLARKLEPDPSGFGTHTQLGLRPCSFVTVTGRPCPACGMTTALAWVVRGRFDRSWQANPAGCVLAVLSGPLIFWLVASAVRNRSCGFKSVSRPLVMVIVAAASLSVATWMVRLIVSPAVPAGQRAGPDATEQASDH